MSSNIVKTVLPRIKHFLIEEPSAARRMVNKLVSDSKDKIILPFNDFPGPITREILSQEFESLTICDPDESKRSLLQAHVRTTYPDKRVIIQPDNIFDLTFDISRNGAQNRLEDIANQSCFHDHRNIYDQTVCDRYPKFLVPLLRSVGENAAIHTLYNQLATKSGLFTNHLLHYHFLMSSRLLDYLIAKPGTVMASYRSTSVLFNSIFDIQVLDSYDLETCFKVRLKRIQPTSQKSKTPKYKQVHLVSLKPKVDVINIMGEDLMEYRFLVYQIMFKRKTKVLDFLDKWFDDCRDAVELGINESTLSGQLNHEQYVNLFLYLKRRRNFKNSTFLFAASNNDEKLTLGYSKDRI